MIKGQPNVGSRAPRLFRCGQSSRQKTDPVGPDLRPQNEKLEGTKVGEIIEPQGSRCLNRAPYHSRMCFLPLFFSGTRPATSRPQTQPLHMWAPRCSPPHMGQSPTARTSTARPPEDASISGAMVQLGTPSPVILVCRCRGSL